MKAWNEFLDKYYPEANRADGSVVEKPLEIRSTVHGPVFTRKDGVTVALQGDRCVRVPLSTVAGRNRRVPAGHELLDCAADLGVLGLSVRTSP
ncbi:MAG: hypothetical protein J0L58_20720 [Burkholderiales bacterium]|nr:hypothetical protein [Burkholderiales bacterium]